MSMGLEDHVGTVMENNCHVLSAVVPPKPIPRAIRAPGQKFTKVSRVQSSFRKAALSSEQRVSDGAPTTINGGALYERMRKPAFRKFDILPKAQ